MNLAIVTDTYPPDINGAALTLGRFTQSLIELGHTVNVIHTGPANASYETSLSGFRFPFYKEVNIGYPQFFKLRSIWKKQQPDVVYVATEGFLGVSGMLAARHLNIPLAAGFHTNFHQYLKRYFIPQVERPVLAILRGIHNYCDATIVPSMYTHNNLMRQGFKNLRVVGRGVNTTRFSPSQRSIKLRESWGADDDTCVIIIVGRIAKEKNLEIALQTIQKIKTQRKLKVVIVGDGPLKSSFENEYSSSIFHWTGLKRGKELAQHYASADVMFFTSETETFGNVIIESLASGLITVAYDYAAAHDHIIDGKNGYTAPQKNIEQLTEKLKLAIENKDDTQMKYQARESTIQLTWLEISKQFAEALESTI